VVDELAANRPSRFEWLMRAEETLDQRGATSFVVRTGGVAMDVQFLLPEGLDAKASDRQLTAAIGPTSSAVIATVLHPRRADAPAAVATLDSRQGSRLTIAIGGRVKLVLDLAGQRVALVA
jgi:hypothetical protein